MTRWGQHHTGVRMALRGWPWDTQRVRGKDLAVWWTRVREESRLVLLQLGWGGRPGNSLYKGFAPVCVALGQSLSSLSLLLLWNFLRPFSLFIPRRPLSISLPSPLTESWAHALIWSTVLLLLGPSICIISANFFKYRAASFLAVQGKSDPDVLLDGEVKEGEESQQPKVTTGENKEMDIFVSFDFINSNSSPLINQ